MKIQTVAVEYSRSFNLGNFENVKIGVSLWAKVDEDEDFDDVATFCLQQAKTHVKENVPPNYRPYSADISTKRTVSGLEVE